MNNLFNTALSFFLIVSSVVSAPITFANESNNDQNLIENTTSNDTQELAETTINNWMPDLNLQLVVSQLLNISVKDLKIEDMLKLTAFDAPNKNITSLKGLEYAENLSGDINLNYNNINDISPLFRLKITYLRLAGNNLTDVSQFLNMPYLKTLVVPQNHITDLSPLGNSQYTTVLASNQIITSSPLTLYNDDDLHSNLVLFKPDGLLVEAFALRASDPYTYQSIDDALNILKDSKRSPLTVYWYERLPNYNALNTGTAVFSGTIYQPVTYINAAVGGNVTIHYQDTEGNQLYPDIVKNGYVGDHYTSDQLPIEGYTFKEVSGNPTGIFTDTAQTVTYIYSKIPVAGADVTIRYQDTDGNTVAPTIVRSGNIGDSYSSDQLSIEGYTFKEVSGNPTGIFTDTAQTVTYIYSKIPVAGADVTIRYQDTDGNTVAPTIVKSGNIGDPYSSDQLPIEGYTFKEVSDNPTGIFTDTAQTVTYIYSKIPVAGADVTIRYQDTNGNTVAPTIVKSGNIGDSYSSDQLSIEGYRFKELSGNSTGIFTDTAQTVTYIYSKNKINPPKNLDKPSESSIQSENIVTPSSSASTNKVLPRTGVTNSLWLTLVGAIMLLATVLYFKRKKVD